MIAMAELQKIQQPEKKERVTSFQAKYNDKAKSIGHIFGTNMALFICILLPVFLIGSVWTDFGALKIGAKFLSDGIVTVALFIVGETLMMRVGADGGKLDSEYISAREEFAALVEKAYEVGTIFMPIFCEWQTDVEMKQAIASRIKALRMTTDELDKVRDMTRIDTIRKYGRKRWRKIIELYRLEPVDLNDTVLLYDQASDDARGGVPISGERYLYKKQHSPQLFISCIFTGLLTVSVAITLTSDLSFARIMYTVFKLIILLFRMATGYDVGARAYNTVEARQLKAKSNYLRQYMRFVEDKTYLKLADKYGDIDWYIGKEAEDVETVSQLIEDLRNRDSEPAEEVTEEVTEVA